MFASLKWQFPPFEQCTHALLHGRWPLNKRSSGSTSTSTLPSDCKSWWAITAKTMSLQLRTYSWFVLFLSIASLILSWPQEFALIKKLRFIGGKPLGLKYCVCGPVYKPVCGSDEKTYPNICTAMCKVRVSNFFSYISHIQQETQRRNSQSFYYSETKKYLW